MLAQVRDIIGEKKEGQAMLALLRNYGTIERLG
jgi:hypothetical protein